MQARLIAFLVSILLALGTSIFMMKQLAYDQGKIAAAQRNRNCQSLTFQMTYFQSFRVGELWSKPTQYVLPASNSASSGGVSLRFDPCPTVGQMEVLIRAFPDIVCLPGSRLKPIRCTLTSRPSICRICTGEMHRAA